MSFLGSDKEKVNSRTAVIERAKKERDQRKNDKIRNEKIIKIQSFFRGRQTSFRLYQQHRQLFDTKVNDVVKLATILKLKNVIFVPPPQVIIDISRSLLVNGYKGVDDSKRIIKLCEYFLIPSLSELDCKKNVSILLANDRKSILPLKIVDLIFTTMYPTNVKKAGITTMQVDKILSHSLFLLIGGGEPYRMKFMEDLDQSFCHLRNIIFKNNYFKKIRNHIYLSSLPLLAPVMTDEYTSSSSKLNSMHIKCGDINNSIDVLVTSCMFVIDHDMQQNLIIQFAVEIFTAPLLTCLLSKEKINSIISWENFNNILICFLNSKLPLPPSQHEVFLSGNWLFGNIASFGPFFDIIDDSSCKSVVSNQILENYLKLCLSLYNRFNIHGILQGKNGVVWNRNKSNMTACAVPPSLSSQILSMLNSDMNRSLYVRILLPFQDNIENFALPDDLKDIKEALSSDGLKIAKAAIQEQQESSTWFTSKWASKLISKTVSGIYKGMGITSSKEKSNTLTATSSSSLSSSNTETEQSKTEGSTSFHNLNPIPKSLFPPNMNLVFVLCGLWSHLFSIALQSSPDSISWKSLCALAFSTRAVDRLWVILNTKDAQHSSLQHFVDSFVPQNDFHCAKFCVASVLCSLLPPVLIASDDSEIFDDSRPLPLHQFTRLVRFFKVLLFKIIQSDAYVLVEPCLNPNAKADSGECSNISEYTSQLFRYGSVKAISATLSDLYTRWARRPYSSSKLWEVESADSSVIKRELREQTPFAITVFRIMPWAIDFHERMKLFREIVEANRVSIQGRDDVNSGQRSKGTVVRVRRKMILEDGMAAFDKVGASIKDRIVVRYVNEFGEEEAGIDIGGLFKDFLTDLTSRVFNPGYGLFSLTSNHVLFPNPAASLLYPEDEIENLYTFLGRVLGKALYENITVQPQFAHFMLNFMNGKYNFTNLINDLATLDKELYKNLMFLKSYDGDISDLCLTFSITDDSLGGQREIDLLPKGSSVAVTAENKHRYINLVAKYYLHDRLKKQARSFFQGLYQVIQPDLLSIFCAPELQILISGATSGIDVEDLRNNTRYIGGYTMMDKQISNFWSIVVEMSDEDKAKLVKFVTSCERPPSLGFADLHPPFSIQRVDCSDDSRLPSASTCFNVLKLPTYSSKQILRDKLLTSIRSRSGFDLS